MQRSFYESDESLDSTFDAGGNVGSGITAATLGISHFEKAILMY